MRLVTVADSRNDYSDYACLTSFDSSFNPLNSVVPDQYAMFETGTTRDTS